MPCLRGGADDQRVGLADALAQLLRRQVEGLLHVAVLLQQLDACARMHAPRTLSHSARPPARLRHRMHAASPRKGLISW